MTGREKQNDKLIEKHYDDCRRILSSKKFPLTHEQFMDALHTGLMSGRRYEPERGISFTTWVTYRMLGAARDILRNSSGSRRLSGIEIATDPEEMQTKNLNNPSEKLPIEVREKVENFKKGLSKRNWRIFEGLFIKEIKAKELAENEGLTEGRISQLRSHFQKKLKEAGWKIT